MNADSFLMARVMVEIYIFLSTRMSCGGHGYPDTHHCCIRCVFWLKTRHDPCQCFCILWLKGNLSLKYYNVVFENSFMPCGLTKSHDKTNFEVPSTNGFVKISVQKLFFCPKPHFELQGKNQNIWSHLLLFSRHWMVCPNHCMAIKQ